MPLPGPLAPCTGVRRARRSWFRRLVAGTGMVWTACGEPVPRDGAGAPGPPLEAEAPAAVPRPLSPVGRPPGPPRGVSAKPFHLTPTFSLAPATSVRKHSVVLISLDTASAPHLKAWGGRAEAPVLETLAGRGGRFSHAYTHFPETCLSHWAMVSGVPPEVHGDAPAARGSRYRGPTLFEIADREGYATAGFVGGVTLTDASCGFGRGFGTYDDRFVFRPEDMRRPGQEVTQRAVRWISAQRGPYVAFVHYFDAHFPYTPRPPWDRRYAPGYAGSLTGSDSDLRPFRDGGKTPSAAELDHVAALYEGELSELDALLLPVIEAAGPDAVVVVTADHGESFGHGYWFNHRDALTEDVLRVPLVVAGPGVTAGRVVEDPVGLQDVAPTVLELAGLPVDTRMVGRSLAAALQGAPLEPRPVFSRTDPARAAQQRSVVFPDGEKLHEAADGTVRRFDLRADPTEDSPLPSQADTFGSAWSPHAAWVAGLAAHQAPAPAGVGASEVEAHQLELLGYREPTEGPGAPRP